jgi:alpha-L-fucosidase
MRLLEKVKTEVTKIRAVVSFESRNGYLLSGIPTGSITGLLQALSRLIPALVAVAVARRSRRSQKHRSAVRQIVTRIKELGEHFAGSTSESVSSEVRTLEEKSTDAISQVDKITRDVDLELRRADEEQRRRLGVPPKRAEDPTDRKEGRR